MHEAHGNESIRGVVHPRVNKEADTLAKEECIAFNPDSPIPASVTDVVWDVLPEAHQAGRVAELANQSAKKRRTLPDSRNPRAPRRD